MSCTAGSGQFNAARESLLALLEGSSEAICAFDLEWRYTYINNEGERLAGQPRENLIGRNCWEMFPKAVGSVLWHELHRAVRENISVEFTHFSPTLRKWMNVRAVPTASGLAVRSRDITAHKLLEEKQQQGELRLRQALDAGQCGLYELDFEAGRITWTDRVYEFFGLTPQTFAGTREAFFECVHPDDAGRVRESIQHAIDTSEPRRIEYRIIRPDGGVRWLYSNSAIIYDDNRKPLRMLGACIDVTERRTAEEELRQRERLLDQAQRMAQVGAWEKDLTGLGNELRWSDECYRIFGYEPGSVVVTTELFYNALHPDDRHRIASAVSASLRENKPYEVEHRIFRPDGSERIVHQWGSVLTDAAGKPARMLGTCQDITERKMAEQAVRASEDRYRVLTDAVVQLMWVNDREGRPTFRNRRWYEYTGIHEERVRPRSEIIHPDDAGRVDQVREAAIAAGEAYEIEYRLRRHDGQYRWHLGRIVPLKGADGRVINWFGTATDVHDIKLAEQETRAARQEAEAANRAKDQFLAVLSHELRTPLTPVVMTVAAMEMDRTLSPQMRDDLQMIRRKIELETKLIDDLLDVTRITNGKLRLVPRDTDVHALLENVVQIVRTDLEHKRLDVSLKFEAGDAQVSADPARLQQVFWNLIKNAIKFTAVGGTIEIRTSQPSLKSICIEVIDNGAGIDPAVLPRIFNAFDQGDAAVTRQFGGLGLGLAISKALTELHGGKIAAQSDGKDRGARFLVELPALGAVQKLVDKIHPMEQQPSGPRLRVLLVEDHHDTQQMLARLLDHRGYAVKCAASVTAALTLLAREPIDVLVSDIGLPDATGHELMRHVRRLYEIPGIAISGFGMDSDIKASQDAGFSSHLTKPVDLTQLDAILRQCATTDRVAG